jgi:outer membrane cobalamin receptor
MLGYQPLVTEMQFEEGHAYDRDVELRRLPYALTEVRIAGRAIKVPARYEEVYRRGARGLGTLIDREEIERSNAMEVKSLLQRIPGVLVDDRGITFQRCQTGLDGLSAIGGRGAMRSVPPAKVQVYIDGVRMTGPNSADDAEHVLRIVPPTAIQVIEVYRGVAEIPAEFLDDACAVIAIWTKAY